jgi:type I restriction-modification system DNA methylase subunit
MRISSNAGRSGKFDRVIMNPPFANQADIAHVTHALKFLNYGGRLVAIMSAGVSFRGDRKATGFREMVEKLGGVIEPLPEGSFKEAGTSVNAVMVTLDAPSKPKAEPTIYRQQADLDL